MQNFGAQFKKDYLTPSKPAESKLLRDALGMTSPISASSFENPDIAISQKQIEILEDAIRRYERLEDIKKFSALVLEDIENVTEDDIKRALELENTVSIQDEKAVLDLIQNEGFLKDLKYADFSKILSPENPSDDDISTYFDDFDI